MIEFLSQPVDFTPVDEGLVFVIESDEQTDFEIEIINNDTNDVVGRKYISNTMQAVVDIAPYVKDMTVMTPPQKGVTQLKNSPAVSYLIAVETDMDSDVSLPVTVSNNVGRPEVGFDSIFKAGLRRTISYGDDEDYRIKAPSRGIVAVELISDSGERHYHELYTSKGWLLFHLATSDFEALTRTLEVNLYCDDKLVQHIDYDVVPKSDGAVRLMWLSPIGTLEHYTFPVTECRKLIAEQKQIFSNSDGLVSSCCSVERLNLRSRCECDAMLESLATVITAPKVWVEQDDGFVEAAVVDCEAITSQFGKVGSISVTLEYKRKEVKL